MKEELKPAAWRFRYKPDDAWTYCDAEDSKIVRRFKEREYWSQPLYLAAPVAAQGWQGIESAPKDETILLFGAKKSPMVVGMLHSRDGWVIDTPSEWATMYPPTHWMPLPTPPLTSPDKGSGEQS